MITLAQLTGVHRRTYQKILRRPISTNVRREAVRSLLETLGEVADGGGDSLKVTRNGHVLVLLSPPAKEAETEDQLIALQHFLKRSESPQNDSNGREAHLLLVIGHHKVRLFRSEIYGGTPQQLLPHEEPDCLAITNSVGEKSAVENESSDDGAFFEPIAQALQSTGKILVFGESSATQVDMDRFIAWLKRVHPDLATRIVGSLVLDADQVSSGYLLAKAREFYARSRAA